MFGRLLDWYTIYTFSRALAPWRNCATCKIHFASKSCVLLYWQRYCTALQQRASAKLCSMIQGMELRNFRRRRHLYSAGRPLRWTSAHISSRLIFYFIYLHEHQSDSCTDRELANQESYIVKEIHPIVCIVCIIYVVTCTTCTGI